MQEETNGHDSLKKSTIPSKILNCPQAVEENLKYHFSKESVTEQSKLWHLGRFDVGDCEIRKTDITIFENGHYNLVVEYHDHGTILGDKFDLNINLWGPAPHDELIHTWNIWDSLGAGDDTIRKIESVNPSQKIKDNFNRIEGANRRLVCTPKI